MSSTRHSGEHHELPGLAGRRLHVTHTRPCSSVWVTAAARG